MWGYHGWGSLNPNSMNNAASRARSIAMAKGVTAMPQHIHARSLLKELPFAWDPLPSPAAWKRPCWEPPVLDYTWFEELLQETKRSPPEAARRISLREQTPLVT